MKSGHEAHPSWKIGDYVAYFASRLIDAQPGTDEHRAGFRNYVFSIGAAACEQLGGHEKVTDQVMNDLFSQNLRSAATVKNLPQVPEIASMSLSKGEWRKYCYKMLGDLDVRDLPDRPIDLLAALTTGRITYKSITAQ